MARFVLVHGAWHGGWCWRRVADLLRAAGHEVWTPTLTGLGERAHLAADTINLSTHVQDIRAALEWEELENVILVGHSYGGMVITGVAEQVPERMARLIYLDAFVPKDGESVMAMLTPEFGTMLREATARGPRPGVPHTDFFGVFDPDDVEWLNRRLTAHPSKSFTEKLVAPQNRAATLPRTYVYCDDPAMGPFDRFFKDLRNDPGWRFYSLRTGHDAMVSDPQGVAEILLRDLDPPA